MTLRKTLCLVFALLFAVVLAVSCDTGSTGTPQQPEVKLTRIEIVDGTVPTDSYVGMAYDLSRIQLNAYYSDGTKKTIPTEEVSIVAPPDTSKEGQTMLIVGYGGQSVSMNITVNESYITTISASGFATQYVYGTTIDTAGVVLTVNYVNGTSEQVPYISGSGIVITLPSTTVIGKANIQISYRDKSTSVSTEIIDPIVSIELDTPHRSFAFREGYNESTVKAVLENIKVNAIYTSGAKKTLTRDELQINYAQINTAEATTEAKTFDVSFGGFTIKAPYTVTSISKFSALILDPTNEFTTSYLPGAKLDDLSKLKLKVVCSDETTINAIGADQLRIVGYESIDVNKVGAYTMDITYVDENGIDSVALSLEVNVYGITSISVSGVKTAYSVGDKFDSSFSGVTVTIVYQNGETTVLDYSEKNSFDGIVADKLVVVGDVNTEKANIYHIAFKYFDVESDVIDIKVTTEIIPDTDGDNNVTEKAPL